MFSYIFLTAEIPNANDDPVLHDIVKKCMIHGPCGTDNPSSPCGTSPKRTLHQVYELLLIEMELIHRNLDIPNKESCSQI